MITKPTRTLISLAILLTFLASSACVQAFTPTPLTVASRQQTSFTKTQLSAWSLPVTVQDSKSYWYQDCGSAIDRHIVYNDEEDWRDNQDGLGLAFARLSFLDDDAPMYGGTEEDYSQETSGSFPLRMVKGVWRRIRRFAE